MAIPPQVIMLAMQLAGQKMGQANQINAQRREKLRNKVNEIPDIANGIGSLVEQASLSQDGEANVGLATFGGALRGGSAGASLGPLGIIGGALLGGVGGFSQANQSNAEFFDDKALNEAFKLSAKTVSPSILGDGGFIEGEDLVPVQMELDEVYVTDDLSIYDSKAKKKHKDMEDEDITDVVRDNSFAFSEQKKMKPSTHAEKTLGYGFAHYSEDGNYSLEKVTMADIFGDSKKEVTFSDAAKMIRNYFKVVREDDKEADLLTKITNDENRQARRPFVNQLINIHEGTDDDDQEPIVPQQFGKGGKMKKKVKKYNDGGFVFNGNPDDFEGPTGGYSYVNANGDIVSVDENGNESIMQQNDSLNSELDDLSLQLDNFEKYNLQNFNRTNRNTSALFDRLGTRSGLASIIQGFSTGLQSTRVNPNLQDARFADQMFEQLSPAIADQITSNGFARANSLASNIARTSPEAAKQVAPRLFDSALRQSNNSRLSIIQDNLNQKRGKARFLNRLGNTNRAERNRADEATRNLINKKRRDLANVGIGLLQNRDRLDVNKFQLDRSALREANDNQLSIFQNRLNIGGMRGRHNAQLNANSQFLRQLENALANRNSTTGETLPGIDETQIETLRQQMELEPIFDLPTLSEEDLAFYGSLA